jgi:rubredoxin
MPLFYCERCGHYFTPLGKTVEKGITARGEFHDPEDSVCDRCLQQVEMRLPSGDIVSHQGTENERRYGG